MSRPLRIALVAGEASGDILGAGLMQVDLLTAEFQRHALGAHVHIVAERVRDGLGLLVDFLGHEMAVIALVDHEGGGLGNQLFALDDGVAFFAGWQAAMASSCRSESMA